MNRSQVAPGRPRFRGACVLSSRLTLFGLVFLSVVAGAEEKREPEKKYGQRMVAEYNLPADTVAGYSAFQATGPIKGESAVVSALLADTVDWVGPSLKTDSGKNPYNVVMIVSGSAKEDGNVSSLWQVGWELQDSGGGTVKRLNPVAGIGKIGVKAGESLSLVGVGGPVSFKEEREVAAAVGFANARNFSIREVKVQVWSGVSEAGWREIVFSFRGLMVALVMMGLLWWTRRS